VKRVALLLSVLLVVGGLTACGEEDSALTVDGEDVLTEGDLQDQLDGIVDHTDFLVAFSALGTGQRTISSGFVATLLRSHAWTAILEAELEAQGAEIGAEDRSQAEEAVTQLLEAGDQQSGVLPVQRENVPDVFFDTQVDLYSSYFALVRAMGGEEAAAVRLDEILRAADVEVADRHGTWDAENASVAPPEGPAPATTTLAPVG
jgi:hypothetical protein